MGVSDPFSARERLNPFVDPETRAVDRKALVHAEQVRASYRTIPDSCVGSCLAGAIVGISMTSQVDARTLVGWFLSLCASLLLLVVIYRGYRRAAPAPGREAIWERRFFVANALHGCAWGSAGIVMFQPELTVYQMWLTVALFLIATSAVSAGIVALMPMMYGFVVPVILPLLVRSAQQQDFLHWVVTTATVLLFAYIIYTATRMNRLILEMFNLRFENELAFRRADEANRAKTSFLAAASHDLRQPIHAMALFVSALNSKSRDPETRPIVDHLVASVEALEGLFDALLDISKLDAGIVQAEIAEFPLQPIFDRVVEDCAPEAEQKGLRLRVVPTRAIVRSDPTLLARIVRNLLTNAIRYTEAGGVVLGCRRAGADVRVVVCDSGIGIEATQFAQIFKEFFQVANPERDRAKGLGLGLAIVERLAQLLGHPVEVRSTPRRGSTFSVTLPRAETAGTAAQPAPAEEAPERKLNAALVVVIDDEAAVLEGMRAVLSQWGCRPVLAGSAEEALAQLAAGGSPPGAVIADYRLREEVTGSGAIERIRAAYGPNIPGVIITADTAPDRLREAQASGYHLMHKPVRPAKLRALLSHLLA